MGMDCVRERIKGICAFGTFWWCGKSIKWHKGESTCGGGGGGGGGVVCVLVCDIEVREFKLLSGCWTHTLGKGINPISPLGLD